jgi:hypothetical protein
MAFATHVVLGTSLSDPRSHHASDPPPPTTSGKRQSEDSPTNNSPSPKKPKSTEQSGKTEDRKKLGLFKFTGEGKIPMPNFKYTNAKGESSTLCCDFVFIGRECCRER